MFTLSPSGMALLLKAEPLDVIWVTATAIAGLTALATGVAGWLIKPVRIIPRLVLVGAGLLMVYPSELADAVGFVIFVLVVALQIVLARREGARMAVLQEKP